MATNQVTVKLTDLTVLQQETLNKYFPVVEKLFLAESTSNTTSFTTADQEFRSGIVNFLDAIEKIFGDNSLNPTTLQNTSEDNFVVESCLESCRLIYRKEFHEFLYLTAVKLKSLHAEARDEAVVKLQECSLRFNLCENKLAGLKDELLSELKLERIWIDEVNNFKKNSVLSEIKAIVLENLNKLIIEELPNLVGEAQVEFYDTFEFRQKVMKLMNFALKSFKEQIPYKEDKISQAKMCKEFDDQVVKIVRDLRNKIRLSPGKLMASEVDSSVTKYSNAIGSMLENDPMAEALDIRIQHETLQELHMPIFKISSPTLDNLRSDYLQNYFDETEQVFQKQICEHSQNTIEFLNQSYQELFEVFDKFVGKEVTNIFEKRKIPMAHIQRIRQTFNEQLKIVVEEIKGTQLFINNLNYPKNS